MSELEQLQETIIAQAMQITKLTRKVNNLTERLNNNSHDSFKSSFHIKVLEEELHQAMGMLEPGDMSTFWTDIDARVAEEVRRHNEA